MIHVESIWTALPDMCSATTAAASLSARDRGDCHVRARDGWHTRRVVSVPACMDGRAPPLDEAGLLALLDGPEGRTLPPGRMLQQSTWRRVEAVAVEGFGSIVVKYDDAPWPINPRTWFAPPRVLREFENLRRLQQLGVPAIEPLACGWSGVWPNAQHTFLVTRTLIGAGTLKAWSPDAPGALSRDEVIALLGDLLRQVAGLHGQGLTLSTFYAKNVLLRRAPDGRAEIALCDIPRLRECRGHRLRQMTVRDLAYLDKGLRKLLSPVERLRLLRIYLEAAGASGPVGSWVQAINHKVARKRHETPVGVASWLVHKVLRRFGLHKYWPF